MLRAVKPIQLLPVLVGLVLLNGCSTNAVNQKDNGVIPEISSSEEEIQNYHIVKRGESLYSIATMYGRDHKDLARWNNIPPPFALNIGQRLILDGSPADDYNDPEPETPIVEAPPVPEGSHRVEAKETLFAIARKYGKNWRDIAKWNNLQQPYNVQTGQILVVTAPIGEEPANNDPIITTPTVTNPVSNNDPNFHIVAKGDNLFKIAKHYGRSMAELARWNNIPAPFSVRLGQKLRVTPLPEGVVDNTLPSALPSVSDSDYHIVQAKDTLYSISKIYKISVANLKLWNKLQPPFNVFIGQKLRITPPATSSNSGGLRPVVLNSIPSYHISRSGETLDYIADKYGLSASDIAKWNGIGSPPNIYPGQRLKLTPPR